MGRQGKRDKKGKEKGRDYYLQLLREILNRWQHNLAPTTTDQNLRHWKGAQPARRRGRRARIVVLGCSAQKRAGPRPIHLRRNQVTARVNAREPRAVVLPDERPGSNGDNAGERLVHLQRLNGWMRMRQMRQHPHGQVAAG